MATDATYNDHAVGGNGSVQSWGAYATIDADPSAAPGPAPRRASIVHNDLKLDNCQFAPENPDHVTSIFDWDMTTLGDPLVDLGTLLNYWPDPMDTEATQRGTRPARWAATRWSKRPPGGCASRPRATATTCGWISPASC